MARSTRRDGWTAAETELARHLLARRAPNAEFVKAFGRTMAAARQHLAYVDRNRAMQQSQVPRGVRNSMSSGERARVPKDVLAEAQARAVILARREPTPNELILGDPPPGRSALDVRQERERARFSDPEVYEMRST